MKNQMTVMNNIAIVIRWAARILSMVSVGVILLFIVGEGFNPAVLKISEWIGFLFFPVGIMVGMIVAWWKEGIGGGITVGSFVIFYAVNFFSVHAFPRGWAFFVFASPALLFLLYRYMISTRAKRQV
jgi:hypothetical protein